MNLNHPATNPGPLTAADLKPHQVWPDPDGEPRHLPHLPHLLPAGCDQQGRLATRQQPVEACTELGADDDGTHHPLVTRTGLLLVLVLLLVPWALAVVGFALYAFLH